MQRIAFYLIFILPLLQLLLYAYFDHKGIKNVKRYIIAALLFCYFWIPFLIDYNSTRKPGCLLPVVSLFAGLWIIGIAFTLITHLIYFIYIKIKAWIK